MSIKKGDKIRSAGTFGLLALLGWSLVLWSCSPKVDENSALPPIQTPDAHFVDLTRKEYRGGVLSMYIQARESSWYEDDQRLEVEGLSFVLYNTEDNSISAEGEADKAVFWEASGDVEFSGYVRVTSTEGDVSFETEKITYKRALDLFQTPNDADITIKAKNQLLMAGKGLLFDVKQKYYEIQKSIHGSVHQ